MNFMVLTFYIYFQLISLNQNQRIESVAQTNEKAKPKPNKKNKKNNETHSHKARQKFNVTYHLLIMGVIHNSRPYSN